MCRKPPSTVIVYQGEVGETTAIEANDSKARLTKAEIKTRLKLKILKYLRVILFKLDGILDVIQMMCPLAMRTHDGG